MLRTKQCYFRTHVNQQSYYQTVFRVLFQSKRVACQIIPRTWITWRLCFIITLNIFFNAAHATSPNAQLNLQLQSLIQQEQKKYQLPALSVSIQLPGGKNVRNYVTGTYTLKSQKSITPDTLMQIGSITKTITASIILQLVEQHKLELTDTIGEFLPQYPRWKKISIYNLLSHTSGIYNFSISTSFDKMIRQFPNKEWTLKEIADLAYRHSNLFQPGKKYQYTNSDYILLGLILEKVEHQSNQEIFDHYLKKYHFANTFYTPSGYPDTIKSRISHGYNRDGTLTYNEDATYYTESWGQSAGAMTSTPEDIDHWLAQLFANKIISPDSLAKMTTVISEDNALLINLNNLHPEKFAKNKFTEIGSGLGIGLIYFPHYGFVWAHSGGTLGYESFFTYNPCNGIIVVLFYSVKPKQQLIFTEIASDIFKVIDSSNEIKDQIIKFQKNQKIPSFCKFR